MFRKLRLDYEQIKTDFCYRIAHFLLEFFCVLFSCEKGKFPKQVAIFKRDAEKTGMDKTPESAPGFEGNWT